MAVASDQVTANAAANDAVTGIAGISADTNAVQPQQPQVDAKKQVFAGNLAFATTESDLKQLFSEVGPVANIQIITRGTRSLGYCFVTFENESDAAKAVTTLNKRVVQGREINVEGAKPQEELAAAREEKLAAKKAAKEAKAAERKEQQAAKAAAANGGGEASAEAAPKSKSRKPKARRPRADDGEEADKVAGADGAVDGESSTKKSTRKPRAKKAVNGEAAAAAAAAEGGRPARQPRQPRGAPQGEPSKTLVFVANLSYDVDDASLKEAFEGLSVSTSHVVRRQFGARRSKGFGFVEFASEQEQQKALSDYNGKDWKGRPLSLKVAIQGSKEQADKESKDEASAATTTQPPSAENA
ncbi:unnamed protein product [Sympodiomycopsis kandeliae]